MMEIMFQAVTGKELMSYTRLKAAITPKIIADMFVVEPTAMTDSAVGYDFFASETVTIQPGELNAIPTGIKAKFPGELPDAKTCGLILANRSSMPRKKGLMLSNSIGVIESDYFSNPENDGEIMFEYFNFRSEPVTIERFERIGQGFFIETLRTSNDARVNKKRGASGSTGV